jgi:ATP-dependent exoDNAse (exonuclease V) beta subunit
MWCPVPLPAGELHRRKLRSDKYKPPAGRLLKFYESDLLVEVDEDTDAEAGDDAGAGPGAGGVAKRRTRSAMGKQLASAAAADSAVKAAEKKKRKRKAASPPVVVTLSILTPRSWEVESEDEEEDEAIEELPVTEDRPTGRSESPAAKKQRELVQKTSEDALRHGLEAQRTTGTVQARMPAAIKPRLFRPKLRIPVARR